MLEQTNSLSTAICNSDLGTLCISLVSNPLLILATTLTLKPWLAILCSLLGCILSAMLLYSAGRRLGARLAEAWGALTVRYLNRGYWLTAFRMVPVAPYSLINLAAGAGGVAFCDFVVGTSLV